MGNKCCCEDPGYHVHCYCIYTEITDCHRHVMRGMTDPAPDRRGHRHKYEGVTSICECHKHCYRGCTDRPEYMCSGHIHYLSGETARAEGHRHRYCGTTDKGRRSGRR